MSNIILSSSGPDLYMVSVLSVCIKYYGYSYRNYLHSNYKSHYTFSSIQFIIYIFVKIEIAAIIYLQIVYFVAKFLLQSPWQRLHTNQCFIIVTRKRQWMCPIFIPTTLAKNTSKSIFLFCFKKNKPCLTYPSWTPVLVLQYCIAAGWPSYKCSLS